MTREDQPRQIDIFRGKHPEVFGTTKSIAEKLGFSPALPVYLASLNHTLTKIMPTEVTGFKLTVGNDQVTSHVDIESKPGFDLTIASYQDKGTYIRIKRKRDYECIFGLADIQAFVDAAILPDKVVTLEAEPFKRADLFSILHPHNLGIERNLREMTEEELSELTKPSGKIFEGDEEIEYQPYIHFKVMLDGKGIPLFEFFVDNPTGNGPNIYFTEFFFHGTPEEVEKAVAFADQLFEKAIPIEVYVRESKAEEVPT